MTLDYTKIKHQNLCCLSLDATTGRTIHSEKHKGGDDGKFKTGYEEEREELVTSIAAASGRVLIEDAPQNRKEKLSSLLFVVSAEEGDLEDSNRL